MDCYLSLILAWISIIKVFHPVEKIMAEIFFLGTGGSVATKERDNTSLLVSNDEALILIDCPGSVIQKIKKLGFDPRCLTSILVTHVHPDHIYGLPSLVHSLMLDECRIDLYGSEETVVFCQELLDLFRLREKKIKTKINFISLKNGQDLSFASSLQATVLRVPHHSSSLAFYFDFGRENKKLMYSGDTPLYTSLFNSALDLDYLIHDCSAPSRFFKEYPLLYEMHTNSLQLGKLCQEVRVRCLIPCHFFGELDFSLVEIEKEIRQNYKGKLIMPRDFQRISI